MDPEQHEQRYVVGSTADRHQLEAELAPIDAEVVESFRVGGGGEEMVVVRVAEIHLDRVKERVGPDPAVVDDEDTALSRAQTAATGRPHDA